MNIITIENYITMGQIKIYDVSNGKEIIQFKGNVFKNLKGFMDFLRLEYEKENLIDTLKRITGN